MKVNFVPILFVKMARTTAFYGQRHVPEVTFSVKDYSPKAAFSSSRTGWIIDILSDTH